ncbi:MAG: hypothetical protein ONB46_02190 [candidate division KSB1 bacterium]|nr:hypothetical protein [candidate division KSB1 bacterium]MDZ7402850.1 hypothetical protein [candidate division KSB1 bacterium]
MLRQLDKTKGALEIGKRELAAARGGRYHFVGANFDVLRRDADRKRLKGKRSRCNRRSAQAFRAMKKRRLMMRLNKRTIKSWLAASDLIFCRKKSIRLQNALSAETRRIQ